MNSTKIGVKAAQATSLCRQHLRSTIQQRAFSNATKIAHSQAPLFLDFLAPSWRATNVLAPRRTNRLDLVCTASQTQQRRAFTRGAVHQAKAVTNPRKDDEGNEMNILITPRAAHRLQAIAEKDKNTELALRVSVESGGCHGFQYLMNLISVSSIDAAEDTLFENEDATGDYRARVVMDEPSLELLKGSSIDYTMELIGSQFKVTGIPGAKSSCGCGTSFDIAL